VSQTSACFKRLINLLKIREEKEFILAEYKFGFAQGIILRKKLR